ncbi:hypothetical protein [Caldisalinibacter kiritimatiensis]|uniref:NodB homology domain-containing protein n=1 Tax=Caldisalinibacter kiritimatiensis TaxID=1304284 RepID=R1CTG4_9FIRM|nr:hypothetical protein [Caldisalinibacter kiritimatiensis]EOC99968.1 hypothetical protein L21TH_2013 [Caldisalinibacter kiritimatiensis]
MVKKSRIREIALNVYRDRGVYVLTLDVDWASEDALKYCYNTLNEFDIPMTFFITHKSKFISQLLKENKIEAGIHPNFAKGSSHGSTHDEVIEYCLKLLPKAEVFRCHRYYDVNDITDKFFKLGFKYDSNLCTLLENVPPFVHRSGLIRFPVFFEDGAYLYHNMNLNFKEVKEKHFAQPGIKVINLHPMHIALNTPDFSYMRSIKDNLTRSEWNNLTEKQLEELSYNGCGIRTFVLELFEFIKKNNIETYTLKEIYQRINKENI